MRVPLSWLNEFVDLEGIEPEEIARVLTLKSVETSVSIWDGDVEGVVFGTVISLTTHPKDEGLRVCQVKVGEDKTVQVITRDRSLEEKSGVLVALPGARVSGKVIGEREFWGVVSQGMLLSGSELGLEDSSEGILKIDEDYPLGTPAKRVLGFGEPVLEVEITPNRGDLLSILGIAREIAMLFDRSMKQIEEYQLEDFGSLDIRVEDTDCKRYRGVVIEGTHIKDAPFWLRKRLWQCGIKSINNVVDVTNYIMLERGQPLHAFDLDKIEGGIVVRSARAGEGINTLMGAYKQLTENNLIIADSRKPLAVAGVIGGAESAVNKNTTKILLEGAYFDPYRIRRSAKSLGIQTESSYRFERNVDIDSLRSHQNRAVELILRVAGGKVSAVKDVYPEPYKPVKIFLSFGKYKRYVGEELDGEYARKVLQKLGFECYPSSCGLEVFVPAFRSFDVKGEADLVEEILRAKNYNSLKSEPPPIPSAPKRVSRLENTIRTFLSSRGFFEVLNFSYESLNLYSALGLEQPKLEIINPLLKDERFLRTSIVPSLIRSYIHNQKNFIQQVSIFELGKVFFEDNEERRLGILSCNNHSLEEFRALVSDFLTYINVDHFSQKSNYSFLHPNLQIDFMVEGEKIGFLGVLHPLIQEQLEIKNSILISELYVEKLQPKRRNYKSFSNYPPVVRDLSLVMDKDQSVDKLILYIKKLEEVEDLSVFSVWTNEEVLGEGKKSVSIRLFLRSAKSMSDEEANSVVFNLVEGLKKEFNVSLR
ncbi:phenylalanine--tRNA ligase subunit beta [Thermocrinis sp.]|uniref:phenylalanine--tRNA ligase subunit beta n=1 Tax=Thermocrinis sp. TaxID=2024383 RepID=UPI002FDC9AF2